MWYIYIYLCMVDKRWLVIFKSIYIAFRWVKQRSQVKFWGKYFIFDVKKRKMFKYFKVLNDSTVAVLRKASTVFLRWGGGLLYTFNWIIVDIVKVLQNLSRFDINDLVDNTAHRPLLHILAKCLFKTFNIWNHRDVELTGRSVLINRYTL